MSLTQRKVVEVAVGVLVRPDGSFLLGSRPQGKPYEGYWEFPGGKLEPGETIVQALTRELEEEIGVQIEGATPWITIEHHYTHAHVRLHFMRVFRWRGEPHGRETQSLAWCRLDPGLNSATGDALHAPQLPSPLLPATLPCLRWLALPRFMGISQAAELGQVKFLRKLAAALEAGLRLVQIREPKLDAGQAAQLLTESMALAREHGAHVVVNSGHPRALWERAQGVHLRAAELAALTERPSIARVGASVHTRDELLKCGDFALDYAVLGPVAQTRSHPGQVPLGWPAFEAIALDSPVPVYAIGGMVSTDLDLAAGHGAHGIAAIRSVWSGAALEFGASEQLPGEQIQRSVSSG
jgi:8-oxo-dGTP diphosphatase